MKRYLICFLLSSFILPVMPQEDYVDQLIKKGVELREMGCFENAVKCYQNGLDISPESMVIYLEMAYSYACMNEMEKSFEYAEKAMLADDRAQELLYIWMFILSARENAKPKINNPEKTDFECLPANGGRIEQIH